MYAIVPRRLGDIDTSQASSEPGIIPIFPGWNVWSIWQSDDLDFSPMSIGLTAERRLRIWIEDQIRDKAGAAEVADPLAIKGSQIQVLPGIPSGLRVMMRKEQVPGCEGDGCAGPTMVVDGPASLKTVRFFNRSNSQTTMPWPHDDNYLVDATYIPTESSPVTAGPGPGTIASNIGKGSGDIAGDALSGLSKLLVIAGGVYLVVTFGPLIVASLKTSLKKS